MSRNIACMCTMSHQHNRLDTDWLPLITKDNYDKELIVDVTKDQSFKPGFHFTEDEVRTNLNFPHNVSKRHYWNSHGNRNIIWFHAHLRMLNFYLSNPDYEYYWFFDDDVRIDDWNSFLTQTDTDDSDFISYFVFKKDGVNSQPNVPVIDNRTTSSHMWLERFPGDGDTLPDGIKEWFGSFFPTVRYSNRAMKKLLELNNQGYHGYGEGFVPTVLNQCGMKITSLITSNDDSNLFDFGNNKIWHKNTIVDWAWI